MSLEEPILKHRLVGEPVTRPDGVRVLIAMRNDTEIATEIKLLYPPRTITHFYSDDEILALGEGDVQTAMDHVMQALYKCRNIETHGSILIHPDHSCR